MTVAGMMDINSPEWDKAYKERQFYEIRLNLETEEERGKGESKAEEKADKEMAISRTRGICDQDGNQEECKQSMETAFSDDQDSPVAAEAESNERNKIGEQTAANENPGESTAEYEDDVQGNSAVWE